MTALVLFILSALILLPSFSSAGSAPFKMIVGYAALNARVSPLWIADEQGLFAKYGLEVQPIYLRGAPTLVAGLASGDMHVGRSGGSAALAAIAGHDFKMVGTFSSHNTYDLVTRPNIKRAEDLRGKTFGLTSIGGTTWMGALLWLDISASTRSAIRFFCRSSAIRRSRPRRSRPGLSTAVALDGVFSRRLKQKGLNLLGEYNDLNQRIVGQAMIVPHPFLLKSPDIVESYLKAEIDALALAFGPKHKPIVIKTLMRHLKVDAASAEEGYQDLLRGIDRKPFTSLEGMRNVQRLMKTRSPKVGEIKLEDVVDNRIMRKLDESGFIDRAYAAEGVRLSDQ